MEQGEYKVGLDTLFKILQVFDLKMGEFFGETETPQARGRARARRRLPGSSGEAQREVRDFVALQEAPGAGGGAAGPCPEPEGRKP